MFVVSFEESPLEVPIEPGLPNFSKVMEYCCCRQVGSRGEKMFLVTSLQKQLLNPGLQDFAVICVTIVSLLVPPLFWDSVTGLGWMGVFLLLLLLFAKIFLKVEIFFLQIPCNTRCRRPGSCCHINWSQTHLEIKRKNPHLSKLICKAWWKYAFGLE